MIRMFGCSGLHVREHPRALLVMVGEEGYSWQTNALRYSLERRFFFRLLLRFGNELLGLRLGNYFRGDR